MSFQSVVSNQLEHSGKRLKSVGNLATLQLENALIQIERIGIEPVHETEFSLLSASITVEQATSTQITDSEIFLNTTTKRMREEAHKIVGHSPDIISDIADAIVKPIKELIDTALKPIQNTVDGVIKSVQSKIDDGLKKIKSGFDSAIKTVKGWVDNGFKFIGEGVDFIKASVKNLLDGVVDIVNWAILALQKGFSQLTEGLSSLLSFEIEDVLKLNDSMSKQFENQQTEKLKKQAGLF